ncbi:Cof-type HAD-IIB family hydrolase [Streptococcus sp. E17BB]|uniref:Cof-type HAD-IIB family hydrolase n=1 Tax=Streptococcus sp. E17BB TaxID=3278714 RepID=UPI00359D00FF
MTKKVIAIDLDGTLLRRDHTISENSVKTIQQVIAKGHTVVIATGRPYRMAKAYYKQLGLTSPMINFNGAMLHIPEKAWAGEHAITIDRSYLLELLQETHRFELDFVASEYRDHFLVTLDQRDKIDPKLFGLNELSDDLLLNPNQLLADPLALLVQTRHEDKYQLAKEIKAYFRHEIEVDSWGGPLNLLEFSPKGINKAYALERLLTSLGRSREDLIAFGDEQNDTEMLAFANVGYAIKNANPMLLEYADQQISYTCDEDGVAHQLRELFL